MGRGEWVSVIVTALIVLLLSGCVSDTPLLNNTTQNITNQSVVSEDNHDDFWIGWLLGSSSRGGYTSAPSTPSGDSDGFGDSGWGTLSGGSDSGSGSSWSDSWSDSSDDSGSSFGDFYGGDSGSSDSFGDFYGDSGIGGSSSFSDFYDSSSSGYDSSGSSSYGDFYD